MGCIFGEAPGGVVATKKLKPIVDVPSPDDLLLGAFFCDPHLRDMAYLLWDSQDPFDRTASVGLCARLGASSSTRPERALRVLRQGARSPAALGLSWARGLPSGALEGLVGLCIEEAADWVRYSKRLAESSSNDERVLLAYWRDRIASAGWVLRAAGEGRVAAGLDEICRWPEGLAVPVEEENVGGLLILVAEAEPWADWASR